MSAEILRQAASLMRERAVAATPGPWFLEFAGDHGSKSAIIPGVLRERYGDNALECGEDHSTAEHIASWHPVVALAVADLIDGAAELARIHEPMGSHGDGCPVCGPVGRALTVARAYLGEAS